MSNVLERICDDKREHIASKKAVTSISELEASIKDIPPPRGFQKALQAKIDQQKPALIAEIKKASPSKGIIREDFAPKSIAKSYAEGGAACLSVLTDIPYFQGDDTYLQDVKHTVELPVLRKDFMVDPYQITESRALGADCILLIMAALDDSRAKELYDAALELNMDVLVEVHDADELERSMLFSPKIVGINSRNLKTLEVDLKTTYELLDHLPDDVIRVAESGIYDHASLSSLQTSGAQAFLVGEHLMRQPDITIATRQLLGTY